MASEDQDIERMTPGELTRATTGPTVHVVVGSERRSYHVPAEQLKYHSAWFANHLARRSDSSAAIVANLESTGSRAFTLFVHYLHTQTLPSDQHGFMKLINRDYDEDSWVVSCTEEVTSGLVLAEHLSAPGFHAAINNGFHLEWDAGLFEVFDVHYVQEMANKMMGKVPQERVIWQFLVDECCSTGSSYTVGPIDEKEEEEEMPKEFLLRCMRKFRELVNTPQQGQGEKRCYLEHLSAGEKKACSGLHMRYDEETRHGYFE